MDATNVRPEDRKRLIDIAKRWHALAVAIVIDPGEEVCQARNKTRPDRDFGPHVVRNQLAALRRGLRRLRGEGFSHVYRLSSEAEIDAVEVTRQRLWTDRRDERGPFDIIGDVHGCADELETLLSRLGYAIERTTREDGEPRYRVEAPGGRKAIFVGDLVDRGPRVADALRLAMDMVEDGVALCVLGNHEAKVEKWLDGRDVKMAHGLATTVEDLGRTSKEFRGRVERFIGGLVSHYLFDGGKLAVAHPGIKAEMQGRASAAIRSFCLFGETTGEVDEYGLPVRHNWASEYRGETKVVFGHTPVVVPEWLNNTLCIDTGCVFGCKLTALRYPEMECVSVPAARVYSEPVRPLGHPAGGKDISAQAEADDLLDLADVIGKRIITTRLQRSVTVREENTAAALEVMTRFAIDPKWLIYLPPTMSPPETSNANGYLEHPQEALAFYRREGAREVVAQEKHMGSRALMVVCRDETVARRRFGVASGEIGAIYTRSGRAFFSDPEERAAVLDRTRTALDRSGLFSELDTDWVLLDAEITPWSAKAQTLITTQYAPTGAAARIGLSASRDALHKAMRHGLPVEDLLTKTESRLARAEAFSSVVRGYTWPVARVDDLKIAPFHLLASEGKVHSDRPHLWHMAQLARLADADRLFKTTQTLSVDLESVAQTEAAIQWWLDLTATGGEGMVVKPVDFIATGRRGIIQPAIKCRGQEYLRIIYGPDYDTPEHLERLRERGLGTKRSMAIREFTLGMEALDHFVAHEPLRRVHECVFGVLALESEPVDPRL